MLALNAAKASLDHPLLLPCGVRFLLVSVEKRDDPAIAFFDDAAFLYLLLPYEEFRRGPDFLNFAPSFDEDWQNFRLLLFGQGSRLARSTVRLTIIVLIASREGGGPF